tara:strand:+ start:489 stop:932 length:444 start_codon:yes stop_codon:yes gene_type:complete
MKLLELGDDRTVYHIMCGVPLSVKVECLDSEGCKYTGWYLTQPLENYPKIKHIWFKKDDDGNLKEYSSISDYHNRRFYFLQRNLPNGKNCKRKAAPKKAAEIIKLIEDNLHTVVDYAIKYNESAIKNGEPTITKKEFIIDKTFPREV